MIRLARPALAVLLPVCLAGCAPPPAPLPPPPPLPPVTLDEPRLAPEPPASAPTAAPAAPPELAPRVESAAPAAPPSLPDCQPGLEMWEGAAGTVVVSNAGARIGIVFYDLEGNALDTSITPSPTQTKGEVAFSARRSSVPRGVDGSGPDTVLAYRLKRAGTGLEGTLTTFVEQKPSGTEPVSLSRTCPPPAARQGKAAAPRPRKKR